jgi:benzodiazapine receptor
MPCACERATDCVLRIVATLRSSARSDRRSLFASIALAVALAVIANGVLSAFGLNRAGTERWPQFAPPGPAIGGIWVALFAGMGAARWFALTSGDVAAKSDARDVVILIALCLAYPFYTRVAGGHVTELCGNIVTFAYAVWLARRLSSRSRVATYLIGAVALWVALATVLVLALVRLNGWET